MGIKGFKLSIEILTRVLGVGVLVKTCSVVLIFVFVYDLDFVLAFDDSSEHNFSIVDGWGCFCSVKLELEYLCCLGIDPDILSWQLFAVECDLDMSIVEVKLFLE